MAKYSEGPGLGEGLMEAGVDVEVTRKDVIEAVVPVVASAVRGGANFVMEHPRETAVALTVAFGAISVLAPEVARAAGPPTPTPIKPMNPEEVKMAVDFLTGGREPASTMIETIVRTADVGTTTAANC